VVAQSAESGLVTVTVRARAGGGLPLLGGPRRPQETARRTNIIPQVRDEVKRREASAKIILRRATWTNGSPAECPLAAHVTAVLAATNKCLAKNNKSPDRRGATIEAKPPMKGYRRSGRETRSRRAPSENGKQTMLHLPSPFYGIWQQRLADKQWPMLQRLQR
jgi:hypothetical protein